MNKNERRKALKVLAVSTPVVWTRPVVDSVVLPVHAQTTCSSITCSGTPPDGTTVSSDIAVFADYTLVPPASGVSPVEVTFWSLCSGVIVEGPVTFSVVSDLETRLSIEPTIFGCNSGVFTFRMRRNDTGCIAECSWPISSG